MKKKPDGFHAEKIYVMPRYLIEEIHSDSLIRPLYLTDIGYYPRALYHYRERPEGCDSHILIYCVGGEGWVTTNSGNTFRITERMLAIIPANIPHSYGADDDDPWSIYWFHLAGEQVELFLEAIHLTTGPYALAPRDADKFVELFHQCYDILSTKAYSKPHLLHVSQTVRYFLSLISLLPGRKEEERKQQYIDEAVQFMKKKLDQTISLNELVSYVQISKQHLNHIFKSFTGYAPIDYYHRLKMQRAGQLLDLTGLSIKEISHSLGFKDPYYFSRMFKSIIGISPTDYRNKLKG